MSATPSPDPFAGGESSTDVFVALLAAEVGLPVQTVRTVLTALWGGGDLDTVALATTVRYALDVVYNDSRPAGWPGSERIELPGSVDARGAAVNASVVSAFDYVASVAVLFQGAVTVTGPWVADVVAEKGAS
jgi:hypothetical protein